MKEIKLKKQPDGTYSMTLREDGGETVRDGLTMQEVIYELEMRTYTDGTEE